MRRLLAGVLAAGVLFLVCLRATTACWMQRKLQALRKRNEATAAEHTYTDNPFVGESSPSSNRGGKRTNSSATTSAAAAGGAADQPLQIPRISWAHIAIGGKETAEPSVRAASRGTNPRRLRWGGKTPLAVLSTGDAHLATFPAMRRAYMVHSVEVCATREALTAVLREATLLSDLSHTSLLHVFAVVTDQPCGEVGLLSELAAASLASVLASPPLQLSWQNGLLSIATDVAAGLAHLHARKLHHGRLFLFNVMMTASWRAKLSEYALDAYLTASHGGLGTSGGYDLLPSSHGEHGGQIEESAVLYLPPEKCSGKMAIAQHRRLEASAATTERRRCKAGSSATHAAPAAQAAGAGSAEGKRRVTSILPTRRASAAAKKRCTSSSSTSAAGSGKDASSTNDHDAAAANATAAERGTAVEDRNTAVEEHNATESAPRLTMLGEASSVCDGGGSGPSDRAEGHAKPRTALEAAMEEAERAERASDAWAFGCLLCSLARHHRKAKEEEREQRNQELETHMEQAREKHHLAATAASTGVDGPSGNVACGTGGHGGSAPGSSVSSGDLFFPFAVGERVRHVTRGDGTVVELLEDGRTKVEFDNGGEHRYHPKSMHKLRSLSLADADGKDTDAEGGKDAQIDGLGRLTTVPEMPRKSGSIGGGGLCNNVRESAIRSCSDRVASVVASTTRSESRSRSRKRRSTYNHHLEGWDDDEAAHVKAGPGRTTEHASARAKLKQAEATALVAQRAGTQWRQKTLNAAAERRASGAGLIEDGGAASQPLPLPAASPPPSPPSPPSLAEVSGSTRRPAPAVSPYMLMLRVCQGRVSPLDGLTPSCMPRPLLQLASLCCSLQPAARPQLQDTLEQLQGNILRGVDPTGVAQLRPAAPLVGWREAAEAVLPPASPSEAVVVAAATPANASNAVGAGAEAAEAGAGGGGGSSDLFDLHAFCAMVGGEMVMSEATSDPIAGMSLAAAASPSLDVEADGAAAAGASAAHATTAATDPDSRPAACVPHPRPATLPSAPRLPRRNDGQMSRRAAQKVGKASIDT